MLSTIAATLGEAERSRSVGSAKVERVTVTVPCAGRP